MTRASAQIQAIREHPAAPYFIGAASVGLFGLFSWLIYKEPPADKLHMAFEGIGVGFAIIIFPGAAPRIAASLKAVLDVVGPFVPWKKNGNGTPPQSGGDLPPSAPSSP